MQLLDTAHRSGQGQRELGKYLVRAQDFSVLEWIFNALAAKRIITPTQFQLDPTALRHEAYATIALRYLGTISLALQQDVPVSEGHIAYLTRYKKMVMDHWTQITPWMRQIIMRAHHINDTGTSRDMIFSVTNTINAVLTTASGDDNYKDELLLQLCSTDVPYLLLCQTDGSTGRYFYTPAKADNACPVLSVLLLCTSRDMPLRAMQSGLLASGKRARNAVVTSIVVRAEQIVSSASEWPIVATLTNVELLVKIASRITLHGTRCLSSKQHRMILTGFASSLLRLTKVIQPAEDRPRLWKRIVKVLQKFVMDASRLGRGRAANLVALVQGDFFACVWECALHSNSEELSADMSDIIARFYHSEVYFAALDGGHLRCILELNPATQPDGSQFVLNTFRNMFNAVNYAYDRRRDRAVNTCSNLWHSKNTAQIDNACNAHPGVCSKCRIVTYCSRACQQEDWNHLHRAECSTLAKQHRDERASGAWFSAQTKEDQLRILDAVANQWYPSASEFNSSTIPLGAWNTTQKSPIRNHPDSLVSMMDFFCASEVDTASRQDVPVRFHFSEGWGREAIGPWVSRIQACVDDMEENKDTVILVDGRFSLGTSFSALVFARLHYATEKPIGERYTILNSIFRTWVLGGD